MAAAYRADNVGSFLRPAAIRDARAAGVSPEELRAIEDREIERVLRKQRDLGFDVFTDGEFRRGSFMSDLTDNVDGFDPGDGVARAWTGATVAQTPVRGVVVEKIAQRNRLAERETAFLLEHSPGPVKMTLPSATQFPAISYKKGVSDAAYATASAFLADVAAIVESEAAALAREGVAYLQIDAPRYSYYIDPRWREHLQTEFGASPETLLAEAIRVDNACFAAARVPGVTRAIHLCRGNNRSQWYAEGGYDAIAEELFATLDVDRFLLEFDDERSGSFAPLRFVPKGKTVVLGLVSSKVPELEDPDDLIRRVERAAAVVPIENLALSPQCGFASTSDGNLLTEDEQWAKLALVVETARRIWG